MIASRRDAGASFGKRNGEDRAGNAVQGSLFCVETALKILPLQIGQLRGREATATIDIIAMSAEASEVFVKHRRMLQ